MNGAMNPRTPGDRGQTDPTGPTEPMMELIRPLLDLLHLNPESINTLAHQVGPWLYVLLFGIIFAETGLVVTPFLPGDSLLFAVGAVAATPGSPINFPLVCVLLIVAAVAGRRRQLCHRLLSRPEGLLAGRFLAPQSQAPA